MGIAKRTILDVELHSSQGSWHGMVNGAQRSFIKFKDGKQAARWYCQINDPGMKEPYVVSAMTLKGAVQLVKSWRPKNEQV